MHNYDPGITEFLTNKINEEYSKNGSALPFSIDKRDKKDNIIAAASGSIIYGAIYTDQLWVHPDYRQKGLGFELMNEIHNYAISQKCNIATVSTMSFQNTKDFYMKCGYQIDHQREGYSKNSKCIFMKRIL